MDTTDNTGHEITRVAVIGAGTMGHGIAQIAALAGFRVSLYDIEASRLDEALIKIESNLEIGVTKGKVDAESKTAAITNIKVGTDLRTAVADAEFVVEAATERLRLKQEIFAELSDYVGSTVILGTNTSALSVTEIAAAAKQPERVIGTHFFNPPYVLTLLELVRAEQTSESTLARTKSVAERMKRDVIVVNDSPGFATSRLGLVLGLEAIRMLENGVASAEDIDRAMTLGYKHPIGPLRLTDRVGLDVRLAIAEYLFAELRSEQFKPPALLKKMVAEGKLGKKSGEGFYRW